MGYCYGRNKWNRIETNKKERNIGNSLGKSYISVVKSKTNKTLTWQCPAIFVLFLFLFLFFLFLPFRMATLKVLILVWIGYEWMGTFIHCINWCNHSEGQFCVCIKTFKCMKFIPWYICKIYQDMHTYTQWYCSVIYSREQTRKYINEKLVELVGHIYKVAWGGFVCANVEISTSFNEKSKGKNSV